MILDKNLVFDGDGTEPADITVTRASINVIDLGDAREMAVGEPLFVTVIGDGLFASSGGTGTLTIAVQGSVNNSAWTTYATTPALAQTSLNSRVIGAQPYVIAWTLPARTPGAARPRYLRLNYTVASGPFTAGAVHAFLNLGVDQQEAYPSGFSTANIAD